MLSFRKKLKPGWLSIQLSKDRVECLHILREANGEAKVTLSYSDPIKLDEEKSLARWIAERDLGRYRVSLMLSPGDYQLIQMDAPDVPREERKQMLKWRLKDLVDYPVETAVVDVVDIPPDPSNSSRTPQVFTVASSIGRLKPMVDRFLDAGVELASIDIPEMAQRNLARLAEHGEQGLAMLSLTENGGLLTFSKGGELFHARQVDVNLMQLGHPDDEQRMHYYERIVLELQRSLDNFDRQFPYVVIDKLLVAPMPDQEKLESYLTSNLYLTVEAMKMDGLIRSETNGWSPASPGHLQWFVLGGAMREEIAA